MTPPPPSLHEHPRRLKTGRLALVALCGAVSGVFAADAPGVLGDLDGDGRHTVRDVVKIVNHLQAIEFLPGERQAFADVNEDGQLDRKDVDFLVEVILENATLDALPKTIPLELSPSNGEGNVALTRESVVRFSLPLADSVTLTPDDFYAEFSGNRVLSRVELSGDRLKATLFYLENLPASARVRVTLKGENLTDHLDRPLDLNRDGQAGGDLVFDFDTVSISPVPRTGVVGTVYASGKAGDGSDRPLQGVIIEVVGAEETLRTSTAADGTFALSPVPAGDFFVNIDGRPVTGTYPAGAYYPFIGKVWSAKAGRMDNPAGGSGEIYLPHVQSGTLQSTSLTEETRIELPAEVLAANPSMAGTRLFVPPNSLFSNNGTRGGRVGMAPVPPDRLPEPLPSGFLPPVVVTIQTDGPTNFDVPVPVRFPNLPDPITGERLPPGADATLWSFDHDVGTWEVAGPMNVSADGQFLETAPGVGVRQPGWHFSAPPRVQGGGGGPAPFPPDIAGNPWEDGGPDDGGLPGPGDPGYEDGGPVDGGPGDGPGDGSGSGSGGPLLGGPGSDYGPGHEDCTFSHVVDRGMVIPGSVSLIGPATSPAGSSLSFSSSGARDTGGRDAINCPDGGEDEVDIPPGPIDYTWIVTVDGLGVLEGTGLNAGIPGSTTEPQLDASLPGGPGLYKATFFALPRRWAVKDEVVEIGSVTVEVLPAETWEDTSLTVSVDAIVPNPLVTGLTKAINTLPGVNMKLDTEETEVTVAIGKRGCIDDVSGERIDAGEEFMKGSVTLKGAVDATVMGFPFDVNFSLGPLDVVVDAKIGLSVEIGAVVSATVGKRLNECEPEECLFGVLSPSITVEFPYGFSFSGYVNFFGYLFEIEETSITGLKAVTSLSGFVGYNSQENCWWGLYAGINLGKIDIVVLNVKVPVPGVPGGYVKFPGWTIPVFDGLEYRIVKGSGDEG